MSRVLFVHNKTSSSNLPQASEEPGPSNASSGLAGHGAISVGHSSDSKNESTVEVDPLLATPTYSDSIPILPTIASTVEDGMDPVVFDQQCESGGIGTNRLSRHAQWTLADGLSSASLSPTVLNDEVAKFDDAEQAGDDHSLLNVVVRLSTPRSLRRWDGSPGTGKSPCGSSFEIGFVREDDVRTSTSKYSRRKWSGETKSTTVQDEPVQRSLASVFDTLGGPRNPCEKTTPSLQLQSAASLEAEPSSQPQRRHPSILHAPMKRSKPKGKKLVVKTARASAWKFGDCPVCKARSGNLGAHFYFQHRDIADSYKHFLQQ